jgi:hypothetical protein
MTPSRQLSFNLTGECLNFRRDNKSSGKEKMVQCKKIKRKTVDLMNEKTKVKSSKDHKIILLGI